MNLPREGPDLAESKLEVDPKFFTSSQSKDWEPIQSLGPHFFFSESLSDSLSDSKHINPLIPEGSIQTNGANLFQTILSQHQQSRYDQNYCAGNYLTEPSREENQK